MKGEGRHAGIPLRGQPAAAAGRQSRRPICRRRRSSTASAWPACTPRCSTAGDDVHFLFKSSPFGSQSHGHNPQNTFQLNAYGEPLLTTCVYRDLHGSKFHYQWAHSTLAHNARAGRTARGRSSTSAAPQGRIVGRTTGATSSTTSAGDAAAAYGGRLARAVRHVAFVKGKSPVLVLYDDLEAAEPCTFQFMLHALQEFKVDEKAATLATERAKAGVFVQYLPGKAKTASDAR